LNISFPSLGDTFADSQPDTFFPPFSDLSDFGDLTSPQDSLSSPATPFPLFPTLNGSPLTTESPTSAHFKETKTKGSRKGKGQKSGGKITTTPEDRTAARKIKHRLIDRARRRRVKDSLDQLKELVKFENHQKPDKATVVASAVREITDLKSKVATLQAQLARMASLPSMRAGGSDYPMPSVRLDEKDFSSMVSPRSDRLPSAVHLQSFLAGLGGAGVMAILYGMDCIVRDLNGLFETILGFRREELVGIRFSDAPLHGRHVHGKYPSRFIRSTDPSEAMVPTASKFDFTCVDFKRAGTALVHRGAFRVVSRILTRDGQMLESLTTSFLLRNEQGEPISFIGLSTPDCRRFVRLNERREEEQEDIFQDLPSLAYHPFPSDFLSSTLIK